MHMTKGILARHSIGTVFVEKRKAKFGRTLNSLPREEMDGFIAP
jgi:hypothetical protein